MPPSRFGLSSGSLVDGLVRMVAFRDPLTAAHLDAVGALSARLAQALEYDPITVERVRLAGRLHDIGKTAIPYEIIHKPMTLTRDEWAEMQMHPRHGAAIVSGFSELAHTSGIIRSHHERIDGRGYPDGLFGSEIPFEARIIAIADAFHAMTVLRSYTAVRTPSAAVSEVMRCAGTQFDLEFAETFAQMIGADRAFDDRELLTGTGDYSTRRVRSG